MHTKYFPVSINPSTWVSKTVVLAFISILYTIRRLRKPHRLSKIAPSEERVLVLGASSGIGEAIALQYAERGAKICVVGRRKEKIMNVANECRTASERSGGDTALYSSRFLAFAGDFSEVNDMVNLRTMLEKEWQGVDTIIVAAGVSALRSLMDVAGVKSKGETFEPTEASESGVRNVVDVAAAASKGNYIGPLISAVTFIPLLSKSSKSPSILLVSSLASVIPAPTRTLYASTKAAGLILYQALSIEHPNISFSYILPSTVEGDFRASAIDGGEVVESDPNLYGLKRIAVAKRCIKAIDEGEKTIFMPGYMRLAHLLYWAWPSFIERKARKKYNFTA